MSNLATKLEELLHSLHDLEKEVSKDAYEKGRQSIIAGLYTEWANISYRSGKQFTEEELKEMEDLTESLSHAQRVDIAITVIKDLFGELDLLKN